MKSLFLVFIGLPFSVGAGQAHAQVAQLVQLVRDHVRSDRTIAATCAWQPQGEHPDEPAACVISYVFNKTNAAANGFAIEVPDPVDGQPVLRFYGSDGREYSFDHVEKKIARSDLLRKVADDSFAIYDCRWDFKARRELKTCDLSLSRTVGALRSMGYTISVTEPEDGKATYELRHGDGQSASLAQAAVAGANRKASAVLGTE